MLKKVTLSVFSLIMLVFMIPMICLLAGKGSFGSSAANKEDKIQGTAVATSVQPTTATSSSGQKEIMDTITAYNKSDNSVKSYPFSEYLKCVVAAEMPATFESEALKAQAVSARTYIFQRVLYYQKNGTPPEHHGAQICTDSTHCAAFIPKEERLKIWGSNAQSYWKKVSDAVDQTSGIIMTYNGQPINAVFHAMSSGATESAQNVWGSDVPYLKSVSSPLDKKAPKYETDVTMTKEELKKTLTQKVNGVDFKNGIFGPIERSNTGGIISIIVGNVKIKGSQFRQILNLRSTNIQFSVSGDTIHMSVFGYGHGVGMSQYGANFLAQEGKNYQQILSSYYTGIQIGTYPQK